MIAAVAWRLFLAAIAVIVVGVQLDRQSERDPGLAGTVPELFRSSAQPWIAASTIAEDDSTQALEEAQRLILRRPLPAEHLRLLSQAQVATGNFDEAALTIQYAAQRGWRDTLSQRAMMELALQAGDMEEAARRFAALFFRGTISDDQLRAAGERIFGESGGPGGATFSAIIADAERRHGQFVARGSRVLPPNVFIDSLNAIADQGAELDCGALQFAQRTLERREPDSGEPLAPHIARACR